MRLCAVLLTLLATARTVATAADYTNTTSGNYNASIWDIAGNPSGTTPDNVTVTNGTVTIQAAYVATNDIITVKEAGILANSQANGLNGSTIFVNGGTLTLGNVSALNGATLTVSNGTAFTAVNGFVIGGAGSVQRTTLFTGSGSLWTNTGTGNLSIGDAAGISNTVVVANGAKFITTSGTLLVGSVASPTGHSLVITNGGEVSVIGRARIGWVNARGNSVVVDNGTFTVAQSLAIGLAAAAGGGTGGTNSLTVLNGGYVSVNTSAAGTGGLFVGGHDQAAVGSFGSASNTVYVAGTNSLGNGAAINLNGTLLRVSVAAGSTKNAVIIGPGGLITNVADAVIGSVGSDNSLIVDGGTFSAAGALTFGGGGAGNNTLTVTNGGYLNVGLLYFGNTSSSGGSAGNTMTVGGLNAAGGWATVNLGGGQFDIGVTSVDGAGTVLVGAGGIITNAGAIKIGGITAAASINNSLTITNGGQVYATSVTPGGSGANRNWVLVVDGGLLEADSLVAGGAAGNTISNRNAIYQFNTSTPTIAPNGAGKIAITDGTISYRAVTDANITNAQVANMAFAGANTFRLNAASNSTTISQTYTFNTGLGAANYTRLELINGHTAYRNGNITIGGGGSMLVSNTRALITGVVTNSGSLSFVNSVGTFNSAVYNNGAWITDSTTNIFQSHYTVGGSGSISADPGDLFVFRSNLVNQSTQNTSWDTFSGTPNVNPAAPRVTFRFEGTGLTQTQQFFHVGLFLDGGFTGTPVPLTTGVQDVLSLGSVVGFQDNFALGRLELTNTTLMFSKTVPNNSLTNALFVNDLFLLGTSHLIISNDMRVYFVNSNNWSLANITLLGNAEIHQLLGGLVVPEPTTWLLWISGALALFHGRRRR